jgi:hypothetical protein
MKAFLPDIGGEDNEKNPVVAESALLVVQGTEKWKN